MQLNTTDFLPIAFVKSLSVSVFPVPVAPNAIELKPIRTASMTLLQLLNQPTQNSAETKLIFWIKKFRGKFD